VHRLRPQLPIAVFSDLPSSFFESRLPPGSIARYPGSFDAGMVQLDSIRVDVDESLRRANDLCLQWEHLANTAVAGLRAWSARCVVADIPAIPLQAAAMSGVPGIAVGNFGWDWIYSDFAGRDPRWGEIARRFAEAYRSAELLLRLPFSEPMAAFRRIEDIPIVATPGRERRSEIAALYGCDADRRWVLLSFTTLAWDAEALRKAQELDDYEFFTVRPLAWEGTRIHPVDRRRISFGDLVASVDCVVSKPGFGILSDCVVNGKPLVYADRSDFREYQVLVDAIGRYLKNLHIPGERLYAGDLGEALAAIDAQPPPPEMAPLGGAELAARRILDFVD
jgi:L-arabinokinase